MQFRTDLPDLEEGTVHALFREGPHHGQGHPLPADKKIKVIDGLNKNTGEPLVGFYVRDPLPASVDVYWFRWMGWRGFEENFSEEDR